MIFARREEGLNASKRQNNVVGCEILCLAKFLGGGGIIARFECLDSLLEITIRLALFRRFGGRVLFELRVGFVQRFALGGVVVVIVIVCVTGGHILRRIVAVPSVRMVSVPVVTPVRIAGPIATEADEDKSAVIIGPERTECVVRAPRVADGAAAVRPGDPVEYPARRVVVAMVVVEAPARTWVVIIAAGLPVDAAAV